MPSTEEKSLRVIKFSGSAKDCDVWSERFKARWKRKGYTKLLLGWSEIPALAKLTAAEEEKQIERRK